MDITRQPLQEVVLQVYVLLYKSMSSILTPLVYSKPCQLERGSNIKLTH